MITDNFEIYEFKSELLICCAVQIEDLSQQAQMAAAEKFRTPDVSGVIGNAPTTVSNPIPEESDEEVCMCALLGSCEEITRSR